MDDPKDGKGDDAAPPAGAAEPSKPEPASAPPAAAAPVAPKPAAPAPPAPPPPKPNPLLAPVPSAALDRIKARFGEQVVESSYYAGEVTVKLRVERVEEIWRFLRDEPGLRFDYLSNLTAVHWPERPKPFEVVYHLYSIGTLQ